MCDSVANDFHKYWRKYASQLRGQLMNQAKNGTLQNATANLVLSGSIAFWDDRHSEGRKWLERLEDEQPEKAQTIQNILLKDMRFQDLEAKKDYSQFLKVGIPIGGAVVGFAISKGTGAALPVQTLLTAGLALVGYPVASNMAAAARDTAEKNAIDAYMHQLEKYKLSVENILNI